MINKRLLFLPVVFFLLAITGCKKITIESPTQDSVHGVAPEFRVAYEKLDGNDLTFTLNESDVTSQFSINTSTSTATAPGSSVLSALKNGKNTFVVNEGATKDSVTFTFDRAGPIVHITNVTGSSNVGQDITISGYLEDDSAIESLILVFQTVPVNANKEFTVTMTNFQADQAYTFTALDVHGNRTQDTWAVSTRDFDAAGVRLNQSGINFIRTELLDYLDGLNWYSLLASQNPIVDESWFGGNSAEIDVTGVSFGTMTGSIVPRSPSSVGGSGDSYLLVDLTIYDMDVNIHGEGRVVFVPWSTNGDVTASRVDAHVRLETDVVTGEVSVDVEVINVSFSNFEVDLSGIVGNIIDKFDGTIENKIRDEIEDQVAQKVPDLVADYLKEIPREFDTTIRGANVHVEVTPSNLPTDNSSIRGTLSGEIYSNRIVVGLRRALGFKYVPFNMPALPASAPTTGAYAVGAIVSNNILNRALLTAYGAGIDRFSITLNGNQIPGVGGLFSASDLVRFDIRPNAPAYVGTGEDVGALLKVSEDDIDIRIYLKRASDADFALILGTTLNVDANLDIGLSTDNKLLVDVVGLPEIKVIDVNDTGIIVLSEAVIQQLVDIAVPLAMPSIVEILDEIPIPSVSGYSVHVREIWDMDDVRKGHYYAIAGNIVATASTLIAPMTTANLVITSEEASGATGEMRISSIGQSANVFKDKVVIDIDGYHPETDELEHRYRLDDNKWSNWKVRDQVTFHHLLAGEHSVEICARTFDLVEESDCQRVSFIVGD